MTAFQLISLRPKVGEGLRYYYIYEEGKYMVDNMLQLQINKVLYASCLTQTI